MGKRGGGSGGGGGVGGGSVQPFLSKEGYVGFWRYSRTATGGRLGRV